MMNIPTGRYVCMVRVKDPEKVRADLLASGLALGSEVGLPSVSVDNVAKGAGVTKGALFHHFPSKRALVEAVFDEMLGQLEKDLEPLMAADPHAYGRFTRAYLQIALRDSRSLGDPILWRSCVADAGLSARWDRWLKRRLDELNELERAPALEAVRLAADGLWLGMTTGYQMADPSGLADLLQAMTMPTNTL